MRKLSCYAFLKSLVFLLSSPDNFETFELLLRLFSLWNEILRIWWMKEPRAFYFSNKIRYDEHENLLSGNLCSSSFSVNIKIPAFSDKRNFQFNFTVFELRTQPWIPLINFCLFSSFKHKIDGWMLTNNEKTSHKKSYELIRICCALEREVGNCSRKIIISFSFFGWVVDDLTFFGSSRKP